MLPVSSPVAKSRPAGEEWQALAQKMRTAVAFQRQHGDEQDARGQLQQARRRELEEACAKLPLSWSPVSAKQPYIFPDKITIFDSDRGAAHRHDSLRC